MARLSLIEQEPKLGRPLAELAKAQQYRDFFPLDDAADLDRLPLFHPARPEPGSGPLGARMLEPAFRQYRHGPLIAYEFADVCVLGGDGIVVLGGGVVPDTLEHVMPWHPDSNVAEARRDRLKLRRAMPVERSEPSGRYLIGFNGAWRDHGHWLAQSLPRLHAFTLLRRRFREIKLALPPLAAGSAQQRSLELLRITPDQVFTLPQGEATLLADAILAPTFDIWSVTNFAIAAADAVVAGLPAPAGDAPERADKVYLHRTVGTRAVANFAALRPILERYGFSVVSFEGMDFAEQVATMRAARHVIGEHGAGTANILFCKPGARVLELFSPFTVQPAYWSIASRRGLDYGYLVGSHAATREQPNATWYSAYEVAPEQLEEAIRATLRLPAKGAVAAPPVAPAAPRTASTTAARDTPTKGFGGIVEPVFEVMNDAARFGRGGGHQRMTLFTQAVPPAQQPMFDETLIPPEFLVEHYIYPAPPAVAAYAVANGVLWSTGFVTLGRQYVAMPDCLPGYLRPHFAAGAPVLPPVFAGAMGQDEVRTVALDRPVAVATHPNLGYGHFLLEVLPRLWVLSVLRAFGGDIPLALSRTVSDWVQGFARLLHAEQDIVWYDGATERVQAPAIVLPAMGHTEYNFHPALNLMVRDLVRLVPAPDAAAPKLLYLADAMFGDERLENGADVEQALRGLGFAVVRLGELAPAQQIRLLAGARVVVAEHGDALNAALFAPAGARVVSINFANSSQSAIARLRGHRIAYVPPADGRFRHWRLTPDLSRRWPVDVPTLLRVTGQMVQGLT